MMNVMFDVDGVLSDFALKFTAEAAKLVPDLQPWGQADQFVYDFSDRLSEEVREKCWKVVHSEWSWWETVPAMLPQESFRMIDELHNHANVYFVTARKGAPVAQLQTVHWLKRHEIRNPNVITIDGSDIANKKMAVANALKIDYSIEDKFENAVAISCSSAKSYLIYRPYNSEKDAGPEVERIVNVKEFLFEVYAQLSKRR